MNFNYKKLILFVLLNLFLTQANSSLFTDYKVSKAYKNKDYKRVIELLEEEQVDNPKDALINYNLGTAYYKLSNFDKAEANFFRATQNSGDNKELKEISFFNLGNTLYQKTLEILGPDWQNKKDLQDFLIESAISTVSKSIENYKSCLTLNSKNKRAEKNKQKAEELLKKLQEKKKNKDNKDKQDKSNKDQEKEKQDKQDKDNKQNKDQQKEENKQEEDKKNQDQKNQEQKQQDQDKKEQEQQDKQEQEKKQEQKGQDNQSPSDQKDKEQEALTQQAKLEQSQKEKELNAILQSLQQDESKLKKEILVNQSKKNQKNILSNQKPW